MNSRKSIKIAVASFALVILIVSVVFASARIIQRTNANKMKMSVSSVNQTNHPSTNSDIEIELIGIYDNKPGRMIDHIWSPDGKPISGIKIDPVRTDTYPELLNNPKARYLLFGISFPSNETIDVLEYVSNGPEPTQQSANAFRQSKAPQKQGPYYRTAMVSAQSLHKSAYYIAKAVIDDPTTHRYRLGFARGPWTTVATVATFDKHADQKSIASGSWGELEFSAKRNPPRNMVQSASAWSGSSADNQYPEFRLVPLHADRDEVRFSIKRKGKKEPIYEFNANTRIDDIEYVTVEIRPYEFREFTNVQFDPDPAAWKDIYWGEEGKKAVADIGAYGQLDGFKYMGQFYAPNGKNWRDYTKQPILEIPFFIADQRNHDPSTVLDGILHFNEGFASKKLSACIDVISSTSAIPGKGLRETLKSNQFAWSDIRELNIPFVKSKNDPYVQFAFRVSDEEWKTIGSTPAIDPKMLKQDKEKLDELKNSTIPKRVSFNLEMTTSGSLGWTYWRPYVSPFDDIKKKNLIRWDAKNHEARLVLRLRSGKRVVQEYRQYRTNQPLYALFSLDDQSELSGIFGSIRIRMADIEAFEVQTRGYRAPFYVVAKTPRDVKLDLTSMASIERQWLEDKEKVATETRKRAAFSLPTTRPK